MTIDLVRPTSVLAALDRPLASTIGRLSGAELERATRLAGDAISELDVFLTRNAAPHSMAALLRGDSSVSNGWKLVRGFQKRVGIYGAGTDAGKTQFASVQFTDRPWHPSGVRDAAEGAWGFGAASAKLRKDVLPRSTFTARPVDELGINLEGSRMLYDFPGPMERLPRATVDFLEYGHAQQLWPAVDWSAADDVVKAAIQRRLTSTQVGMRFFESHVHGGITPDDIEEVRIFRHAIDWDGMDDVVEAARARDIPVRIVDSPGVGHEFRATDWTAPAR